MFDSSIYPKTKQVLENIKNIDIKKQFYLAGGTALALQLGHRKSIDLDFFIADFPKHQLLIQSLSALKPKIINQAQGTLDMDIDGVKVSFLEYKYPLINPTENYLGVAMASIIDIACMKLTAISSRGAKKDFIDLYFLLKKYTLSDIFDKFEKKYQGVKYQKLHILKSIVYFADADVEPDPDMLIPISWDEVKKDLEEKVKEFFSTL